MSGRNRYPFTATQWQELEHQALIFKYMASGIPIPPDLLFTIKRSYNLDSSSLPSKLFPNHPQHVGWNCFQMGLGRKIDPEPGRCRRTDGKKWRCSKEAFPDSKYCERHMHRGKNRSRKPVEVLKSPSSSALTTSSLTSQTPNSSSSFSSLSSDTQNRHNLHYPYYNNTHILDHHQPMIYHHQPRTHHGLMGLSSQDSNTSLHFDSDWREKRNRYGDQERAFFSEEPSKGGFTRVASSMNDSWQLTPVLTMSCSSSSSSKQHYLQLQSGSRDAQKQQQQQQQQEQSQDQNFVKLERKQETQKTIHFFDEWPVKERDSSSSSWPDLDDKSSNSGSVSTTQLSISIPSTNSSYDFPIFTSSRTTHNGD